MIKLLYFTSGSKSALFATAGHKKFFFPAEEKSYAIREKNLFYSQNKLFYNGR